MKRGIPRAAGEIRTMESALEAYKADYGSYPDDGVMGSNGYTKKSTDTLDARTANNPSDYAAANLVLYRALSGDRNLDRKYDSKGRTDSTIGLDGESLEKPLSEPPTAYYTFPSNMLLPANGVGTVTGLIDPFGNYYGYSTACQGDLQSGIKTPVHGYNQTYDLWSTAGTIIKPGDPASKTESKRANWLYNWQTPGTNTGK